MPSRVQAVLAGGNRIEVKTDNVATFRFYLNDQMVDFREPVTVMVNGKARFEGKLTPDVEQMLKDQLFLGRGWRYYTAVDRHRPRPARARSRRRSRAGKIIVKPKASDTPWAERECQGPHDGHRDSWLSSDPCDR